MQKQVMEFNKARRAKNAPGLKPGDVVRIFRRIKEGDRERTQVFEGIVIAIKGGQSSSPMVTVRKVSQGVGVELILPVYSSEIEKIELVKSARVRRAKLYYLKGRTAKKSRMKYKEVSEFIPEEAEEATAEEIARTEESVPEKVKEKK